MNFLKENPLLSMGREHINLYVESMLMRINRDGMDKLVEFMKENGFFDAPASTIYHGNYKGGLVDHSLNLYFLLSNMNQLFDLKLSEDTITITAILHDICKINLYDGSEETRYKCNEVEQMKGHAIYSLEIIEQFLKLTDQERDMIKYHMGMYGAKEMPYPGTEYKLSEILGPFNKIENKLMYFADDMAAQCLDMKKGDIRVSK